jgi:hypothetical protein
MAILISYGIHLEQGAKRLAAWDAPPQVSMTRQHYRRGAESARKTF